MSNIFTFRASDMNAAYEKLAREFGPGAVIRDSREVTRKRMIPWGKPVVEIEVTAEIGTLRSSDTTSFNEGGVELDAPQIEIADSVSPSESISESNRLNELEQQIDSIQSMLAQLGKNSPLLESRQIPQELFELYTELLDADLEEPLANQLIQTVKKRIGTLENLNRETARNLLSELIQSQFECQGAIRVLPGQRKVVALVGPTGVGKTTTIAKLAANFCLRDGIRMGLVTVDTFRIAAVEQLRTYAEIIDLPMKVVTNADEMQQAMDAFADMDLVLIDTAGRSPRDDIKIHELRELLERAGVDEVHLVMSTTAGRKSLLSTLRNFRIVGVTSLLMTKLDESESLSTILECSEELDLPISYLTTGQNVPDDIEAARSDRLADLILGRKQIV